MQDTHTPTPSRPRVRRSPNEIATLLDEYRQGGLTQRAFALSKGLSLSTLSSWLSHRRIESPGADVQKPRLVPVRITDDPTGSLLSGENAYGLSLPDGVRLTIPLQFDEDSLRRLLSLLTKRC